LSTFPCTSSPPVVFLFLISLTDFFTSLCKIYWRFSSLSTFSSGSTPMFRSIRFILNFCNIILPNFEHFNLIYYSRPLGVFDVNISNPLGLLLASAFVFIYIKS
jgi:hypothetical protein